MEVVPDGAPDRAPDGVESETSKERGDIEPKVR